MIEIPLSENGSVNKGKYVAIVDDKHKDLAQLNWSACPSRDNTVYAHRGVNGTTISLHQTILSRKLGRPLEKGELVDHIDGNGLNCLEENLRVADYSQNQMNKGAQKNNKSGHRGVYYDDKYSGKKKWNASIRIDGKSKRIGRYHTLEEAVEAYKQKSLEIHKEFSKFNRKD